MKNKITGIGGGTGLSTLFRGLRNKDLDISGIISVTDDGGSSGRLREGFGILPPGDFRNCLVALSDGDASDIRSRVANLETLDLD